MLRTNCFLHTALNHSCCGRGAAELLSSTESQTLAACGWRRSQSASLLPSPCPHSAKSTQTQGPGISPGTRPDNRSMGPVLY